MIVVFAYEGHYPDQLVEAWSVPISSGIYDFFQMVPPYSFGSEWNPLFRRPRQKPIHGDKTGWDKAENFAKTYPGLSDPDRDKLLAMLIRMKTEVTTERQIWWIVID